MTRCVVEYLNGSTRDYPADAWKKENGILIVGGDVLIPLVNVAAWKLSSDEVEE